MHERFTAWIAIAIGLALAACGGGGGGDDVGGDDGGGDDGGGCGTDVCEPGACGGVFRDGCEPVDCGQCRYDGATIDADGTFAALHVGAGPVIAYARGGTAPEIRIARELGGAWTTESVTVLSSAVMAIDFAVAPDGTEWIVWGDEDAVVSVASRQGGPWTVEAALPAVAARPRIAVLPDGTPMIAYASQAGLQLAVRAGATWSSSLVAPDLPRVHDLALAGTTVHVAWRTDDAVVHHASGGVAGPFTAVDVDASVSTVTSHMSVALAVDAGGAPHVVYSNGEFELFHAIGDGAGGWSATNLARYWGANGGAAITLGARTSIAYFDHVGLEVADATGGGFAQQMMSDVCDEGSIDLGIDPGGALHIVYGCEYRGVFWRVRTGERYPDGWLADCTAVAADLADIACSCTADPERSDCCVGNTCSAGLSVPQLAEGAVCGDPTLDPSYLEACRAGVAAAVCTLEDEEGHVTVPDACD
jgi:hypothetical protein